MLSILEVKMQKHVPQKFENKINYSGSSRTTLSSAKEHRQHECKMVVSKF
jgi:hypothetical protein